MESEKILKTLDKLGVEYRLVRNYTNPRIYSVYILFEDAASKDIEKILRKLKFVTGLSSYYKKLRKDYMPYNLNLKLKYAEIKNGGRNCARIIDLNLIN